MKETKEEVVILTVVQTPHFAKYNVRGDLS